MAQPVENIRILEVAKTNLLQVITDNEKDSTYYTKTNLEVSADDGRMVLKNSGVTILDVYPYQVLTPNEESVVDLVNIIQGYLDNLLPELGESPFTPEYIAFGYSPSVDAFGRARVSQLTSQADIKQVYEFPSLFIDEETNGTASVSHSTSEAATEITTAASGDWAVVQTKQRYNYSSGKSQEIFQTFYDIDSEENVEKKVGYFSSSTASPYNTDYDGFWIEASGGTHYIVTSKGGTETSRVARDDWYDSLDGTGPSGLDYGNFDGNIIIQPDFEWLGLGQLRYVVVHGGLRYIFHAVDFVNGSKRLTTNGWVDIDPTFKGVYMISPNQPLRWEVRQTGAGSSSTTFICSTVGSEGAINKLGKVMSDNLGISTVNANSTLNVYALLGIQLQASKVGTLVDILDFSILTTTSDNVLIQIWLNPTVAGTFNYSPVTNSNVAIAKGDTAGNPSTNTITNGTLLYSRLVSAQNSTSVEIENAIRLGMAIDGTLDDIVITARPFTSNCDVTATIGWRELS